MPGFLFDIRGNDFLSPIINRGVEAFSRLAQAGTRTARQLTSGAAGATLGYLNVVSGVGAAVVVVRELTKAGLEYGRSLNQIAEQSGDDVATISSLQITAARAGLSVVELRRDLDETGRTLEEFQQAEGIDTNLVASLANIEAGAAAAADAVDDLARRREVAKASFVSSFADRYAGVLNPVRTVYTDALEGAAESQIPLAERSGLNFGEPPPPAPPPPPRPTTLGAVREAQEFVRGFYGAEPDTPSPFTPGGERYGAALSGYFGRQRAQILNEYNAEVNSGEVSGASEYIDRLDREPREPREPSNTIDYRPQPIVNVTIQAGIVADEQRVRDYVINTVKNAARDGEFRF